MNASTVYMLDNELGRINLPALARRVSYRGLTTRKAINGEVGIFVAKQHRLINGTWQMLWASVTHNERVDAGAQKQAVQMFAGGGTPAAPSATLYPKVIAVSNATLTKAKTDLSLGSASADVTTNEFTTLGLSRLAVTAQIGGNYTLPGSLGGTFAQLSTKLFTASGNATALGGGLYDSTTVAGSILYVEDNFASSAVLVNNDTLTVNITITN